MFDIQKLLAYNYRERNRPIAFMRSVYLRGATKGLKYPNCFYTHNAPRSVVRLFTDWVQKADIASNGTVSINLQHQKCYSNATAQKAIKWLTKHNLIEKRSVGVGRGVASRYLIGWSFIYKSLTDRQRSINSKNDFMQRLVTTPTIVEKLASLQRRNGVNSFSNNSILASESNQYSRDSLISNTYSRKSELKKRRRVSCVSNKKPHDLIERSTRYALFQLRKHTDNKDAIRAAARIVRQKMAASKIFAGPELNQLIDALGNNDYDNKSTSMVYRMVGSTANEVINWLDTMKERSIKWLDSGNMAWLNE